MSERTRKRETPSGGYSMYITTGEAIAEFLRLNLTDPRTSRAYTTTSDSFNGDGTKTQFALTHTSVRYISSIVVGGVTLDRFRDYNYDLGYGKVDLLTTITFTNAPVVGVANVVVNYAYSGVEWIYSDWPDFNKLSDTKYPRISVIEITSTGDILGSSSTQMVEDKQYQIDFWVIAEQLHGVTSNSVTYNLADANLLHYLKENSKDELKDKWRDQFLHRFGRYSIISSTDVLPSEKNNILRMQLTISFREYD